MQPHIWEAKNLDELKTSAQKILQQFPENRIFILNGDLGAGKTALVKAFAEILHVKETVSSPTFSLVHEYRGDETIYHFDLYRLNETQDLYQIGFEEYLDAGAYVFIEWPELALPLLQDDYVEINITMAEEFARKIACRRIKNT
ncbi:MAG: tRNA (adenosine(37)-N6)-threonylcarbamoyltransferase complex ATPase subunit type 1 TsaE [Bacteroidia bacterium]